MMLGYLALAFPYLVAIARGGLAAFNVRALGSYISCSGNGVVYRALTYSSQI